MSCSQHEKIKRQWLRFRYYVFGTTVALAKCVLASPSSSASLLLCVAVPVAVAVAVAVADQS